MYVYGPCDHASKPLFLDSLRNISSTMAGPWVIMGDFNLLRDSEEKSTDNFDQSEADCFNDFINALELQDIPLLDRLYTWSNNQASPTLCRLDRALVNLEWSLLFPDSVLASNTRSTSDHVPIILQASTTVPRAAVFRFNNHYLELPGFSNLVLTQWNSVHVCNGENSASTLCKKLKKVRSEIKKWEKIERNQTRLSETVRL